MIERALDGWLRANVQWLFIENVGNLVCPANYDLGEHLRVVLLSVTEGEDKPLKYPSIFNTSDLAVITKNDLAAVVGFDRDAYYETSARSGLLSTYWKCRRTPVCASTTGSRASKRGRRSRTSVSRAIDAQGSRHRW